MVVKQVCRSVLVSFITVRNNSLALRPDTSFKYSTADEGDTSRVQLIT